MAMAHDQNRESTREPRQTLSAPSIALPKSGGAIRGIGEKFAANPVTGTGSLSIPIAMSPSRSGFSPQLSLSYDSGAGNGPFGFGWGLSLPSIGRKTDKGLPRYGDAEESDVYILSGAEDLVPVLRADGSRFEDVASAPGYAIHRYRPRIEGLFARMERWTDLVTGAIHWRSITRDNITSLYGRTSESQIADGQDSNRVFSWMICESRDDKGNAVIYEYAPENDAHVDATLVSERNRARTSNRYLKRIKYGNRTSHLIQPDLARSEWMFEVVFDYDEDHCLEINPECGPEAHRLVWATPSPPQPWRIRPDPFSSHRAGFEVRTYRRCRRVLLFHRFAELAAGAYLVRATEFSYDDLDYRRPMTVDAELAHPGSSRFGSFLRTVTQSGFVREDRQIPAEVNGADYVTYRRKSLPSLEFDYSKAIVDEAIHDLSPDDTENLPIGLDGKRYQWVDINGEGVSGILSQDAQAWYYKPNLGDGHFDAQQTVAAIPSLALPERATQQLIDLAGDGQLDLVTFAGPTPGFYERTPDETWSPFAPFTHLPNIRWDDPNLRFVDLDGDGHVDLLLTGDEVFTWHPSLAEEGFGPAQRVRIASDEERGPRLLLSDGTQSIYLADMCGDGLSDLVRIRNGEVCYWPNVGYGRFGAQVVMDHAPWFDPPDHFDHGRIRLADIDGSGVTDIVYLGDDGVRLYFNQSGNRWSEPRRLTQSPPTSDVTAVMTADLLGAGTACLVWSSPLPGDARRPLRYIDLMGRKPHLLVGTRNNLGAETSIEYAPSTEFYLADKRDGKPWVTRIPFPVHVVERVITFDRISGNRFMTRYSYHHGYFDGPEREFRGFGRVDQFDTEEFAVLNADERPASNVDEASHVPPVLTRTWFHTGACFGRDHVSDYFAGLVDAHDAGEYFREPGLTDLQAKEQLLEDTVLPDDTSVDEIREACRALKGVMLRQEVYGQDRSDQQRYPYSVIEQNFTLRCLQRKRANRHAVYLVHAREALHLLYERNPVDPRVTHELTLEVDDFGNVTKSAAVAYGRRAADLTLSARDRAEQGQTHITCTEREFTNAVAETDAHRTPLPCETRAYQLTGLTPPPGHRRFGFDELLDAATRADAIAYERRPAEEVQKRLIEQTRILYRRDNLAGPLPLGELQALALPFESYALACTSGLVAAIYGGRAADSMLAVDGGYVPWDNDGNWWVPSGRVFFSAEPDHTVPQELAYAREHFFLPHRYRDPFHADDRSTETFVTYDPHDLLVRETRDALGNLTNADHNYRVLQPERVTDPNRNRVEAAFDALGMVVGTAVMGKALQVPVEGDSLDRFEPDLTQEAVLAHLGDPRADPEELLGQATTRLVYDLFAYERTKERLDPQPAVVYSIARETHASDPKPLGGRKIQHLFSYSDGFGREIQRKAQAEAGPLPRRGDDGKVVVNAKREPVMEPGGGRSRWVASGWTVFNNKGKPVRQYEPFFTDRHQFEFDVRIGVSAVLFYDPVERLVATLHPNHTWEKVVFGAWRQDKWDTSDTVLIADSRTDGTVGDFVRRLPDDEYLPSWFDAQQASEEAAARSAAAKSAVHANTPTVSHVDALGRIFLTIAHNAAKYSDTPDDAPRVEEFHRTRIAFDIEGNQREVVDALDRVVMRYDYDMLGHRIHQASMEAGERWTLTDVAGQVIYAWNSREHVINTTYDRLRRPVATYLTEPGTSTQQVGRIVYGDERADAEVDNLRGKVVELFDQAGVVRSLRYDFKGNLRRSERELARDYKTTLDWRAGVQWDGAAPYASETTYDALNRPVTLTAPDDSVIRFTYNDAGLLNAIDINLHGLQVDHLPVWAPFVKNIEYNAKGQRAQIEYGSGATPERAGVTTNYEYDRLTLRLAHLQTSRDHAQFADDCQQPPPAAWPGCDVQNLHYTYDAAGNIVHITDKAQQRIYFRNRYVDPASTYTYDATGRLIEATGREHVGEGGRPVPPDAFNRFHTGLDHPGNGQAMTPYLERYVYDFVGNLLSMSHPAAVEGWVRTYAYTEPSQVEPAKVSNRLTSTTIDGVTERYRYEGSAGLHGNITSMPHLSLMEWDYRDQLRATAQQVQNAGTPGTTWYVYDAQGQRVRKVTESSASSDGVPRRVKERIYLGGFEVFRKYDSDGESATLERQTLHVMDDKQRIALIESRRHGSDGSPEQLVRYEFGNHLGSSCLELDADAQVISYEEYFPYGSTSYQAARSDVEAIPKRYRYTGMERDEESGFGYHRARSYATWLGRWTASDPIGLAGGINPYEYSSSNPITFGDTGGLQPLGELSTTMASNTRRQVLERRRQRALERREYEAALESVRNSRHDPEQWRNDLAQLERSVLDVEGAPIPESRRASIRDIPRELELQRGSTVNAHLLAGASGVTSMEEYQRLLAQAEGNQAAEAAVGALAGARQPRMVRPRAAAVRAQRSERSPTGSANAGRRHQGANINPHTHLLARAQEIWAQLADRLGLGGRARELTVGVTYEPRSGAIVVNVKGFRERDAIGALPALLRRGETAGSLEPGPDGFHVEIQGPVDMSGVAPAVTGRSFDVYPRGYAATSNPACPRCATFYAENPDLEHLNLPRRVDRFTSPPRASGGVNHIR
jgi:RHS repeat-associated protein